MSEQANSVVRTAAGQAHILAENARYLIATAGRAPSVHNSQPWQFLVTPQAVELWSDPRRKLRTDPIGREMMISCGAALFGLRLGTACVPPVATAVPLTPGNRRADWLRAGQALQRLLLRAAGNWVFASLHTQPIEDPVTRDLIRDRLSLHGSAQLLLQFGRAGSAASTPRRPPGELSS
jgi:hypothetical protein